MHYNTVRNMAKRKSALYRRCDAHLLRQMSRAARGFDRARGTHRLEALRRYVAALNEFSDRMLGEWPSSARRVKNAPRRRPVEVSTGALRLRMTSELIPYVGVVGAKQILKSASVSGQPELPAVESVLGMFLGKAAATRLMDRMIGRARIPKSPK